MIKRIDPPDCGCTDCLTGYSKPLGRATDREVLQMLAGKITDATAQVWTVTLVAQSQPRRVELASMTTSEAHWAQEGYGEHLDDKYGVQRVVRAARTVLSMREG